MRAWVGIGRRDNVSGIVVMEVARGRLEGVRGGRRWGGGEGAVRERARDSVHSWCVL